MTSAPNKAITQTHGTKQSILSKQENHSATWAEVASHAQPQGLRVSKEAAIAFQRPRTLTTRPLPKEDIRIFVEVPAETRLQKPSPFAVRQALCSKIKGLKLENVPTVSPLNTG